MQNSQHSTMLPVSFEEIEVGANDVAAALLRYCAASGVPIPMKADKELEVVGESLAINLRIETAAEPVIGSVTAGR